MRPFLQSVAKAYSSRFHSPGFPASEEYCFVFPNKRAGTFFLKYLRDLNPDGIISPEITTISDFTSLLSGRIVSNRIDLIFLLYNCYCDLLSPDTPPEERGKVLSFDSFRKWGDTVLRDFNDVDMQNVDAEAIFKNISDLRKIMTDFLTEDQKKVIEEYFGYQVPDANDDRFWIDFDKETLEIEGEVIDEIQPLNNAAQTEGATTSSSLRKKPSQLRSKFIHLWKVLAPLYKRFRKAMDEKGFISSGAAYRLAVDNLIEAVYSQDGGISLRRILPWRKIVMIGFNALSMSERLLFRTLSRIPSSFSADEKLVDFIWDSTGPVLSDRRNPAGRFVKINSRDYPSPRWIKEFLDESETKRLPEKMEIAASPSKVMQVKIASKIITDLKNEIGEEPFNNARVALVVPDESLLLPLLYSIPEGLEHVNLTMGYPLKLTSVTSFLILLRRLQLARRDSSAYTGFAYENLSDLLSHPYAHAIFGTKKIREFKKNFEKRHLSVVRESELARLGPNAAIVLKPLDDGATSTDVIRYLQNVLMVIANTLRPQKAEYEEGNNGESDRQGRELLLKQKIELSHINAWFDALRRFEDAIEEYGVRLSVAATLGEAYRLLQGESAALEGEPLQGLQIMGMLETRALDFDHIVIVGLNDRTIPGRMRQRSFIPNIIRRGFGMPVNTYQEELFGYYFFRLISRAKSATFIYDNRVSGGNGGESRYLLQLRYLYARDNINISEYKFNLSGNSPIVRTIIKTDFVEKKLKRFIDPEFELSNGRRYRNNISASLMKTYTDCPVKFYYKAVLDLKDDPETQPSVDPIEVGNIVHQTIEELYLPDASMRKKWLDNPVEITSDLIDQLLSKSGQENILNSIMLKILTQHHHLKNTEIKDFAPGAELEIIAHNLRVFINDILKFDRKKTPFRLYGTEINDYLEYPLTDKASNADLKINMRYALDRVDDIDCEEGQLRIVDYKTGGSHISAKSIQALKESDYRKNNLLQLLIYSLLANYKRELEGLPSIDFKTVIYPVGRLMKNIGKKDLLKDMVPQIGGQFMESNKDNMPDFQNVFEEMLREIFDVSVPFEADVTAKRCDGCPFIDACKA